MLNSLTYLRKLSKKILPPNEVKCVIEIGANKCTESIDFTNLYPHADIYPFECNPDTIPLCREAIKDQPNIHLMEMAVSDTIGTLDFFPIDTTKSVTPHKDGNPGASSLFKKNEKIVFQNDKLVQKKVSVQSTTLKEFMIGKKIASIDILWLDAQGAELMILRGAEELISSIRLIQCEVEFIEEYEKQPLYKDIKSFLSKKGFIFCGFSDEWYPHAADAIFMHKDTFKRLGFYEKIICRISALMPLKILFFRKVTYAFRRWYRKTL